MAWRVAETVAHPVGRISVPDGSDSDSGDERRGAGAIHLFDLVSVLCARQSARVPRLGGGAGATLVNSQLPISNFQGIRLPLGVGSWRLGIDAF